MRKMLFIYNPRAGKGMIRTSLSYILEEFSQYDMEVTVHPTREAGDAAHMTEEFAGQYDLVVCSGGDGTLDEVVTGMMQGGFSVPVGYIPAGSTNDFASSLGIPKQMRDAAAAIAEGRVFDCDIGRINASYFIYVAAFGAFTDVSYKTSQDMKNMLGHAAYLLEGVKSFSALKSWRLRFMSEEMSGEGDFLYGMITNSNSVGGFKGITGNDVTLNDGKFEVTLIRMPETVIEWPTIISALLTGTAHDKVITFKTAHLKITGEEDLPWTTDGEYGGTWKSSEITNLSRALPIILDPTSEEAQGILPDLGDQRS